MKFKYIIPIIFLSACNDGSQLTYKEYENIIDNSQLIMHCKNATIIRRYKDELIYINSMKIHKAKSEKDPCEGVK